MEKIINQNHDKNTFLLSFSKLLERGSYYGIRSLIILYMISEVLKMENKEAFKIYTLFSSLIIIANVLGATLGDLVLGNKKSMILGCVIQALGAFSLCIPSLDGLYIGLSLILLGGGLYSPNLTATFGKLYLNKTKLLDSAFTILFIMVNIGAFLGTLLIGRLGENYNWNYGFGFAGILMLLSIIPILIFKENIVNTDSQNKTSFKFRLNSILLAILFVGVFWTVYELSRFGVFNLQIKMEKSIDLDVLKQFDSFINSFLILTLSFIVSIIWTFYYSSQFTKMVIGFVLAFISYTLLFLQHNFSINDQISIFLLSLTILGVSEVFIAPVIQSTLTKYSKPKYLAIIISLAAFPSRIFLFVFNAFDDFFFTENSRVIHLISLIVMIFSILGLLFYLKKRKDTYNTV